MTTTTETGRERARAIRTYRKLRATAAHKLALAESTRCGLDTSMRLRDEADYLYAQAADIAISWNLRRVS